MHLGWQDLRSSLYNSQPCFYIKWSISFELKEDANFLYILLQNVKCFYSNKCNMVMTWCAVERTKTEAEESFSCCHPWVANSFSEATPLSSRPRYRNAYHKSQITNLSECARIYVQGMSIYRKGSDRLCLGKSGRPVDVPEFKAKN